MTQCIHHYEILSHQDLLSQIIDDFLNTGDDQVKKELWKAQAIIKLMELSRELGDNSICKDGIIFVLSLYNDYDLEEYYSESTEIHSRKDRERILPTLMQEITVA